MESLEVGKIFEDMANLERKWGDARRTRPRERRLGNTGGSTTVVLPKDLIRTLGWKVGDDVIVRLEGRRLIIE